MGGAGIATYIGEATRALSNAGHECHVLSWSETASGRSAQRQPGHVLHLRSSAVAPGDPLLGVDPDLRLSKWVADWVLDLHREHGFDVIEGTDWCAPLYCLLQNRADTPALARCLITVFNHGTTYNIARYQRTFTPRQVFQRVNLEHQCFRLADLVVCPSEAARDGIVETHDARRERTTVISEPISWSESAVRRSTHLSTLLYFGSVSVSKGLNEFIDVANRYLARHPDLRVEFIGPLHAIAHGERDFRDDISRRLRTGVDNIAFSGQVPRADALEAISSRHLLINMSRRETFCYAFAEGIMQGACPLARQRSAQAEFIPLDLRAQYTGGTDVPAMEAFTDTDRERIQEFARNRTAPEAYAKAYEQLARGRHVASPRKAASPNFTGADVTVLVPAHNPDDLLFETIASIHSQSAAPKRIIVGNDGSKGESALAILERVAELPRVTVVDFDWRGLAETRNRLLRACDTRLFAFVDADDLLMPEFIEASVRTLEATYAQGVRSVQGWYELFGSQSGVRGPVIFQHFSHALWNDMKNNHVGVTEVFRDLQYNGGLNQGEAEDWELWLRYFHAGWETRIIPEVLWRYRRHPSAMSSRWSEAMSVGTARANAKVMRSLLAERPLDHVWEFIGEYMYLGETFFNSFSPAADAPPRRQSINYASMSKLERRLMGFMHRGAPPTLTQRIAIRLMRSLARTLK